MNVNDLNIDLIIKNLKEFRMFLTKKFKFWKFHKKQFFFKAVNSEEIAVGLLNEDLWYDEIKADKEYTGEILVEKFKSISIYDNKFNIIERLDK